MRDYDFVRAIAISCIPVALSPTEIEEASYFDEELTIVKSCVRSGDWDRCTLPSYAQVKDELCVYGELLLRGTRIVVPKLLARQGGAAGTRRAPGYSEDEVSAP